MNGHPQFLSTGKGFQPNMVLAEHVTLYAEPGELIEALVHALLCAAVSDRCMHNHDT